jgi:hypothetical protein
MISNKTIKQFLTVTAVAAFASTGAYAKWTPYYVENSCLSQIKDWKGMEVESKWTITQYPHVNSRGERVIKKVRDYQSMLEAYTMVVSHFVSSSKQRIRGEVVNPIDKMRAINPQVANGLQLLYPNEIMSLRWHSNRERENVLNNVLTGQLKAEDTRTKLFVDQYYDTNSGTLSKQSHIIRQRKRYNDETTDQLDWSRVQYKSDPFVIGSTWFRTERGDCRVYDAVDGNDRPDICRGLYLRNNPNESLLRLKDSRAFKTKHDGALLMLKDHPRMDVGGLRPISLVEDQRFRIVFEDDNRDPVFELSLDRMVEYKYYKNRPYRTNDNRPEFTLELELEILKSATGNGFDNSTAKVVELLELSDEVQGKLESDGFKLETSLRSKGGARISSKNVVCK